MTAINMLEREQSPVTTELADLINGNPFDQNMYDNLCRFMIYFSLAESKLAPMGEGIGGTDKLAKVLRAHHGIDNDVINDSYTFFIRRYRDNPGAEGRFRKLAPSEYVGIRQMRKFENLLQMQTPTMEEKLSFVFKVIFRLRHNLFHGEKWSYKLEDQNDNFSYSVNVLLSTLTLTRGILWNP
ncbi:hypothetical protein [Klebsiella variicola]|uniref:hypothetical protein n=2 Tax=Klebsiella variicola TaxID=244366 RepID=UPI001B32E1AB|nr:hypothetical protein [Klebsiella variicola]MBP5847368.1 hypothetical protein [Klebsiella variicola]HDH1436266.1 hypothetical protein [Klebsiella quasipneumoniae subsp. similipneumoniae]